MNQEEYKALSNTFVDKLKGVCKKEGLTVEVLPDITTVSNGFNPSTAKLIRIEAEVYLLYNDGNSSRWDFLGRTNA